MPVKLSTARLASQEQANLNSIEIDIVVVLVSPHVSQCGSCVLTHQPTTQPTVLMLYA